MMSGFNDFQNDIDWSVYKGQQTPVAPAAGAAPQQQSMADYQDAQGGHADVPMGKPPRDESDMVDTFLGKMPRHPKEFQAGTPENKKMMDEMINGMVGGPGMKIIGEFGAPLVKAGISKAAQYMQPGKVAEEFRGSLGSGTSSQNIEELSKRLQFGKQSAKTEALAPKNELYSQEGKTDVFNVNKANLPEGNLPKMGEMIAPGEKFGDTQMNALSRALKDYRKTGSVESFIDKSEDIFNIPELSEKAASKIEDALLMPLKRDSKYFAEEGVTDFYGKRGLKTLHDTFEETPTLANYDSLQSAIKKQVRKLEGKGKNLDTAGEEKLDALKVNVKNLNADKETFMQTLPDKMQNLENEFRQKYATNVAPYENAGLTIRKLAEGKAGEVSPAQVAKAFTRATPEVQKILSDLGPGAGRNVLYSALQKVPPGDAEGLANTLLDLKRTKGYDQFVTKEMEQWANNMLKHTGRVNAIKKGLGAVGGAAAGSAMFGPIGGIVGAAAPFAGKHASRGIKYLAEKLGK